LCLLLTFSCHREEEAQPQAQIDQKISVWEEQEWFEKSMQNKPNARSGTNEKGYSHTKPQWHLAQNKHFRNGQPYIQVPLEYNQKTTRWKYDPQNNTPASKRHTPDLLPNPQLIVFKNKDGKTFSQVMELIPEQQIYSNQSGFIAKEKYTGLLFLKNWKGNY